MNTCPTGKRCYLTIELAEEGLIGAHIAYSYGKGNGPVDVYQCDECGYYHLTSSGEMNKRLSQLLNDGKIKDQKEADWWEGKLRKKSIETSNDLNW